jgi:glutamate:Na+ symporter, ESS family
MPVTTVKLSAIQVLAISAFGVSLGVWLKQKFPVLDRLNIPASIVGGLVYAVITLILRDRFVNFEMDLSLQSILMVAFFTTIGMSASLRLVKEGGLQVIYFFGLAFVGAFLQNMIGIGMAKAFGLNPLLGIISGAVALTGGPATALAFGQTFEKSFGVEGATTLGVASAMFGITAGGILGGYIGGSLISRHRLKSEFKTGAGAEKIVYAAGEPAPEPTPMDDESESERSALLTNVIAIAVAMGIGSIISAWFEKMGLVLPAYIGAMMAAAVIRNLDDKFQFARINQREVDTVGNISLYLFIVMALLTLRLWELVHLALPTIAMLIAQVALIYVLCMTLLFRVMGRDYESAVMAGGFCGFMLGTTANAMACMDVLAQKYGPAPRSFVVVPLVGAFLIDFANALLITTMANFFR